MGTPDFSVPAFEALHQHHEVIAVFCQPDRPKGRSKKPVPCPVKQAALTHEIAVHQPRRIRARKWVNLLRELAPDLIVVAAFGQILPQSILDIPPLACVNIHASLLPRWRGASPIHHAILHGDAQTGVGIMKMEVGLDEGPVFAEAALPIDGKTGRIAMEQQLARLGADLLIETIPKLGDLTPKPQDDSLVTYAPIIEKSFGICQLAEKTAIAVRNMVLAFEEWPGTLVTFRETPIKLLDVSPLEETHDTRPGEILTVTKKGLTVACAEGTVLAIRMVQPSGKKPQPVAAFNNGYQPQPGESFT